MTKAQFLGKARKPVGCGVRRFPPFAKGAKDGAPLVLFLRRENADGILTGANGVAPLRGLNQYENRGGMAEAMPFQGSRGEGARATRGVAEWVVVEVAAPTFRKGRERWGTPRSFRPPRRCGRDLNWCEWRCALAGPESI
jgi:hypothetical protein